MSFNTVTIHLDEYNELIKRNKELEKIVGGGTENLVCKYVGTVTENWGVSGTLRTYSYIRYEDIKGNIVAALESEYRLRLNAKDEKIEDLERELLKYKTKKPSWRFW